VRLLGAVIATVTATTLLASPLVTHQPAAADCAAPTVTFKPARVARGGVLTISGQYLGDDCLDTGTLPPGVGPLGSPLSGLAIVINQGENEFLVAAGSADSDYAFEVDVVVPSALVPGEAVLSLVGAGDARMTIDPPLVISSASPIAAAEGSVVTFGPPTTDVEPPGSAPPVVLPAEIPDEPVDTAPPLSTPTVDNSGDNTSRQRAISAGFAGLVAIAAIGFAVWSRSKRA
jgi:hypothetical protein